METTLTTDKNNFFCGGQHARRFKNAARFRGEKENVVFHKLFLLFPIERIGKNVYKMHVMHG